MNQLTALETLDSRRFETPAILKRLASSSRKLAELKGIAASMPNQGILINTLGLQEAKDSSEIENIVKQDMYICMNLIGVYEKDEHPFNSLNLNELKDLITNVKS